MVAVPFTGGTHLAGAAGAGLVGAAVVALAAGGGDAALACANAAGVLTTAEKKTTADANTQRFMATSEVPAPGRPLIADS
jgi:hypothetical protein